MVYTSEILYSPELANFPKQQDNRPLCDTPRKRVDNGLLSHCLDAQTSLTDVQYQSVTNRVESV